MSKCEFCVVLTLPPNVAVTLEQIRILETRLIAELCNDLHMGAITEGQ